jgi:hypothetical protein
MDVCLWSDRYRVHYAHHSCKKKSTPHQQNTGRWSWMQQRGGTPILLLKIMENQVITLDQYLNQRLIPLTKKAEP